MSTPPTTPDGSACAHLHLNYWSSWIENRDTFVPSKTPGVLAKRAGGGAWCPLCAQRWGWPREQVLEADAVPSLPLESGAWAVFVMPDGSLTVEASGALTDEEAEDLSDALRKARRAGAARRDAIAGRDRWRVERIKGATVLSRWHEGHQRALCLGQVTPRKSCSCDLCEGPIPRGALAWKGLTEDPPLPVRAAPGADAFRVCSGCVERLTVPEAQPAQAWPVRGLEC